MNPAIPDNRTVLSIRQPWAFLIIRPDLIHTSPAREEWLLSRLRKDIENRGTRISYRGTIWIHAPLTFDVEGFESIYDSIPELRPALTQAYVGMPHHQTGGIIGKAELTGCVQHSSSLWFHGPHGWELEQPEAVPFEKLRGMPGLFRAGQGKPPQKHIDEPTHPNEPTA